MEQSLDKVTKTLKLNSDPEYYIAFSDVHGNSHSIDLIKRAQFDYPSAQLVGLGDYKTIILRGNHEQIFLNLSY